MQSLTHDDYDNWLDEAYEPYNIGYIEFEASRVLKELDPIAYEVGYSEWADSEEQEDED